MGGWRLRQCRRERERVKESEKETRKEKKAAKWPARVLSAFMARRDREKSRESEGEKERRGLRACVQSLFGTFYFFYFLYLRVKYPFCPSFSKGKVPFALLRKLVFTFSPP